VNKALLEYEIKRNGFTIGSFCETLGMSRSAFYRKCNGISEFGLDEIKAIKSLLRLSSLEPIFFAEQVS
jgi:DNA-binding NtrC family response regulator